MKKTLISTAVLMVAMTGTAMAGTLETLKERGALQCGVTSGVPGFS
ncbi:MAG: amino acid ABC transporter substrate-binding protein, partial [Oceanospirillales bacterium]|nr:amino acid ABC transporter substrate-binding protein [Oceanospirillales bacterium]